MPIQVSASHSALLLECPYPFTPNLEFERDEVGEPGRYGSAFHSLIAFLFLNKGAKAGFDRQVDLAVKKWRLPPSSAKDLPGHVRGSYGVLLNWLKGKNPWARDFFQAGGLEKKPKLEVEKSFAINPWTGEVRSIKPPSEEEHFYSELEPGELAGTADLILGGLVIDHKTGSAETFDSPLEKAQLKTLGLVPHFQRRGKVIVGVLHADRRGLPTVYADEAEAPELNQHSAALAKSLGRVGDGSMRPGPWCARCPAREVCPAQHGELLKRSSAIVAQSMGVKEFLEGDDSSRLALASRDVGKVHQMARELENLLEVLKKEIRQRVEDNPSEVIVRPDGKELALVPRRYERLSKTSVLEALGKLKGEKELKRLRKLGALSVEERLELHAVRPG